ncbi:hypothetical protein EVAR_2406_1 [Eumeta japonica]|uniref:Peptidase aspartic putative domain-containing protein n=1 Tax=Eumeta variegata TaxID=151549 RepID=A0A4C1SRH2_EUMVA|nr:hypothetical protein EVAR_2406_1 [Eumeta japonica]
MYNAAAPYTLIGHENWGLIVTKQIKSGRANQPAASLTQLGWVLHGCCSSLSRPINTIYHLRPSDASDIELNDVDVEMKKLKSINIKSGLNSVKLSEHETAVSLIIEKARVAPLKKISIPRLELQAALLGARLTSSILNEIELNVTRKIFWTDSRTVLSWIRSDPRSFTPFVAHRLDELEEHVMVKCWRWMPTKLNVADDATRSPPTDFDETHRWFHDRDFLRKNED